MEEASKQGDLVSLYRQAFARFGVEALWSLREKDAPTREDALAITRALRTHGGMEGRRLAEATEGECDAG